MIKKSLIFLCPIIFYTLQTSPPLYAKVATTFFNQQWLKSVVSIEQKLLKKPIPIGTGFLVSTEKKHVILVTAKHVVINEVGKLKHNLAYRLNLKDGESYLLHESLLPQKGAGTWFFSNKSDVAVRFLWRPKESDLITIPLNMFIEKEQIQPGTPALILGFPMGLRSEKYAIPIVRKAIVALNQPNDLIMIDGFVFPGSSGGPVVYMPAFQIQLRTLGSSTGNYINEQKLIGLISGHIYYRDVAVSKQTKRQRISFEENTGLSNVVSSDEIIKLLNRKDFKDLDQKLLQSK